MFHVRPEKESGKRLKTKASQRRVPVHSHLIELGFLRHREAMKTSGEVDLFPMLKQGRDRGRGDALGKYFGRYKRTVGITSGRKVFHSFRVTVNTRLRGIVPEDTIKLIVGHTDGGDMTDYYTRLGQIPLAPLREAIEKLNFRHCLKGLSKVDHR